MIPYSFNPLGISNSRSLKKNLKLRFYRAGTTGANRIFIKNDSIVSFKVNGVEVERRYDPQTYYFEFTVDNYKESITIEIDAGSKYNVYKRTDSFENMNDKEFAVNLKNTETGHSELTWNKGTYITSTGERKSLDLDTHFLIRKSDGTKVVEVMHNKLKYSSNNISVEINHDGGYNGTNEDEYLTIYKLNPQYQYDLVMYDYSHGSSVDGTTAVGNVTNPNTGRKYVLADLPIQISADGIINSGCGVGDFTFNISNDVGPFYPTDNPKNNLGLFWHVFRINPGLVFEEINEITLENTEEITLYGTSTWPGNR